MEFYLTVMVDIINLFDFIKRLVFIKTITIFFLFLFPLQIQAIDNETSVEIYYFDDSNSSYNIEGIIQKNSTLFDKKLGVDAVKFHPHVVLWMRIDLHNNSEYYSSKVVKFLDIRLDKMEIYSKKGELLNSVGDMVPFSQRRYKDAQIAIDIETESLTKTSLYVRFSNVDKSDLTYTVFDKEVYIESIIFKKMIQAFFFGALMIMLLYNAVLYLFIREKSFLFYLLYHSTLLVVMLYYNGLISQYYLPDDYDVNGGNVPGMFTYMSVILAMQFLRYFLSVKSYTPKIDRWLQAFIYINIILLVLTPFDIVPKNLIIMIMMPLSLFLLFVASYHAFVLRRGLALFYLLGWLVMLIAIILTGLLSMGFIERNDFTAYIFQIGIMIELTLLSMGLAYRYKLNQDALREKSSVLHEQSKLASMGEMMRHISHQWRQPLSEINSVAMKIETEYRRKRLDEERLDQHIEQIEEITEHMSKTIQDFNGYFKSDKEKVLVTLESVVDKAISLVMSGLSENEIKIEKIVSYEKNVSIVEGELIQVLLVLLNNARDAINSADVKEKWIKIYVGQERSNYIIEVEDSGDGIDEANLAKVFEPYFTTKFESQGVGIGLYMSKMIVEESMGGRLSVSNSADGAIFKILFEC